MTTEKTNESTWFSGEHWKNFSDKNMYKSSYVDYQAGAKTEVDMKNIHFGLCCVRSPTNNTMVIVMV